MASGFCMTLCFCLFINSFYTFNSLIHLEFWNGFWYSKVWDSLYFFQMVTPLSQHENNLKTVQGKLDISVNLWAIVLKSLLSQT